MIDKVVDIKIFHNYTPPSSKMSVIFSPFSFVDFLLNKIFGRKIDSVEYGSCCKIY